ncbi:DUF2758 domain-containing protein [Lactiplantibacillus plantarum]|uniref:DUF2758 domain-containing protein n=1 Tax=Lactiplantibacillus plantarum TaxID=1590 RepID=UPI0025B5AC09|nr:DUF2758 domain-containing protein [Lactiplantibacillus plantarum]MDN3985038.1 DUF2758 domain-containing protein [Lactiplantibacillus plantarum]
MKIKTFRQPWEEDDEEFDSRVNYFIEDKQVVQITTNETVSDTLRLTHSLTVLYKECNE